VYIVRIINISIKRLRREKKEEERKAWADSRCVQWLENRLPVSLRLEGVVVDTRSNRSGCSFLKVDSSME
jgi:hypothetical protein